MGQDIMRRVTMTTIRLKRDSFPICSKKFSHIGNDSKPIYKPSVTVVSGEVASYHDHKLGIYRREHRGHERRKWDYVLVDLATGRTLYTAARKIEILQDLEDKTGKLKRYLEIIEKPHYSHLVAKFQRLKQGG